MRPGSALQRQAPALFAGFCIDHFGAAIAGFAQAPRDLRGRTFQRIQRVQRGAGKLLGAAVQM